jgi:hypothetical protein
MDKTQLSLCVTLKRNVIACTSATAPIIPAIPAVSAKKRKAPVPVQMAYPRHLLARDLATFHEQGQQRHIDNAVPPKLCSDLGLLCWFRSFYGQAT